MYTITQLKRTRKESLLDIAESLGIINAEKVRCPELRMMILSAQTAKKQKLPQDIPSIDMQSVIVDNVPISPVPSVQKSKGYYLYKAHAKYHIYPSPLADISEIIRQIDNARMKRRNLETFTPTKRFTIQQPVQKKQNSVQSGGGDLVTMVSDLPTISGRNRTRTFRLNGLSNNISVSEALEALDRAYAGPLRDYTEGSQLRQQIILEGTNETGGHITQKVTYEELVPRVLQILDKISKEYNHEPSITGIYIIVTTGRALYMTDAEEDELDRLVSTGELTPTQRQIITDIHTTQYGTGSQKANKFDQKIILNHYYQSIPENRDYIDKLRVGYAISNPMTRKDCLQVAFLKSYYEKDNIIKELRALKKSMRKRDVNPENTIAEMGVYLSDRYQVTVIFHLMQTRNEFTVKPVGSPRKEVHIGILAMHAYAMTPKAAGTECLFDVYTETKYKEQRMCIPKTLSNDLAGFNIATFDMETCDTSLTDKTVHPYAIGLRWYIPNLSIQAHKEFFETDITPDVITPFIHHLIDTMTGNHVIYSHNGGKFDIKLIMNKLLLVPGIVMTNCMVKGARIMTLTITINAKFEHGKQVSGRCIIFRDSITLMQGSLSDLCKGFNVTNKKFNDTEMEFRHADITRENCRTLEIRTKVAKYLRRDCESLLEVLERCNDALHKVFEDIHCQKLEPRYWIMYNLTSSSIARSLFGAYIKLENQKKVTWDMYNLSHYLDSVIRPHYHGGRCQILTTRRIYNGKIYYYDFTSHYAAVMKKYKYPLGKFTECPYTGSIPAGKQGFLRVIVKHHDTTQLPFLALSGKNKLTFPILQESSEEILVTIDEYNYCITEKLGYTFEIKGMILADSTGHVFSDIIDKVYKLKANAGDNKPLLAMSKVIISSIYGFFGMNQLADAKIIAEESAREITIQKLLVGGMLNSLETVGRYTIATYSDYLRSNFMNVGIAAYITSFARMELYKLMRYIQSVGGELIYCDTDSIMTNVCLEDIPFKIHNPKDSYKELGSLTNESGVCTGHYESGVFISPKFYALKSTVGPDILKAKGVNIHALYTSKVIDHVNKKITFTGLQSNVSSENLTGLTKTIEYSDYTLIANGYTLCMETMTFMGSSTGNVPLRKIIQEKQFTNEA